MVSDISLNPLAAYHPASQYWKNFCWKGVWSLALMTSIVAFTALAALAIGMTSTLWPSHLPTVTLIVLAGGLPLSSQVVTHLWKKMDAYRKEARYDLRLKNGIAAIADHQIYHALKALGIYSSADLAIQKRLLSRYRLLQEEAESWLKQAPCKDEEVELFAHGKRLKVHKRDFQMARVDFQNSQQVALFERLQKKYLAAQRALYQAALCHIKAAYILQLIQRPDDLRTLSDCVRWTTVNPLQHMIAHETGDPTAQVVVVAGKVPYTREQILALSTAQLAHRMFGTQLRWLYRWGL